MKKTHLSNILSGILLFVSLLAFISSKWYIGVYGDLGFSAVLSTLTGGIRGTSKDLILNYLFKSLIPAVIIFTIIVLIRYVINKKLMINKYKTINNICIYICSFLLFVCSAYYLGIPEYLVSNMIKGKLYDEYYVNPLNVNIDFPEEKRNLIYIFLESMETSYLSKENGGGLEYTVIPNLYRLANENINFSDNEDVGGMHASAGTGWTIASLVTQTSGISLSGGVGGNDYGSLDKFLPGVYTLNDLLADNGYHQAFFIGSDATFGGRDKYFLNHGVNDIYDYITARDRDKWIPEDYYVWWGYEDYKMFDFSKNVIMELAEKDEPFAFFTLTVDTHHIAGYVCDKCENLYTEQYENVISCSDRQVIEYIEWIQSQDFYENTTIVVVGDHLSMDNEYVTRVMPEHDRKIYNCIINSPVSAVNSKNRVFTAHDMFPTTLAALGCEIEGERLGLGTNLFSNKETLAEYFGIESFDLLLSEHSEYYFENFMNQ